MAARVRAPALAGRSWINAPAGWPVPFDLSLLRGKVVLLDFWTYCCINCLRVLDELRPLEERFADEVVVLGIHSPKFPREGEHEAVVAAVARHRVSHPVLDDPGRETWYQYAVRGWPTLVLVDPAGYVVGRVAGEGGTPVLVEHIERMVAEHDAAGTLRRGVVQPVAGGTPGSLLSFPGKVAVSTDGTRVAVADTGHDRVLVVRDGVVERIVRGLSQPQGVRFTTRHGLVVCDTGADRVLTSEGHVLAEGIRSPWDVVEDADGSLVVAEAGRHRLWRIPDDGPAVVVAGNGRENVVDGPAAEAQLAQPSGLTRVPGGIAFADSEGSALRVLRDDGEVETLVGTGLFDWDELQHPLGVAAAGRVIYVADTFNSRLCRWADGTLAVLPAPGLEEPGGLDVLPDGRLLVADTNSHRVVVVDPGTGRTELFEFRIPEVEAALEEGDALRAAGGVVRLTWQAPLDGEELDATAGPPVRVRVEAAGRVWEATSDQPTGAMELAASDVDGELVVEVSAATCTATTCTVRTVRRRHRVEDR